MKSRLCLVSAALVLMSALALGLVLKPNGLVVAALKAMVTLLTITGLLIYYGIIKVSTFRREHIQKRFWFVYIAALMYLLPL